jgi:hypothetical protein
MRDRDVSLVARLSSEGVLESRQRCDASTCQIGHMRRTAHAAAVVGLKEAPLSRLRLRV